MAEQSTSQQDDQKMVNIILANVGTVICFRTGNPADEKLLLPLFSPYLEEGNVANLPPFNFYMRASAIQSQEPFSGETIKLEGEGSEEIAEQVIKSSREHYAKKYVAPEPKVKPEEEGAESTTKTNTKGVAQASQPRDRLKRARRPTVCQMAARWMTDEINRAGFLKQEAAAHHLTNNFKDCIEQTEFANPSISKKVRDAFKRLHRGTVMWDEENMMWRKSQ